MMYRLVKLTPSLIPTCAKILQEEWPSITTERLHRVVNSSGHDESDFPCSMVMVQDQRSSTCKEVLAHCRITKVLNYMNGAYIESLVVDKSRRGQGLGKQCFELAESYLKSRGISHTFISTWIPNASLFIHLGYRYIEPKVVTHGPTMLGSSPPPPYSVPLPGWEFVYVDSPSVFDLLTEEQDEDSNLGQLSEDECLRMLKTRTVKYYDEMKPELEDEGYAWLAKSL